METYTHKNKTKTELEKKKREKGREEMRQEEGGIGRRGGEGDNYGERREAEEKM